MSEPWAAHVENMCGLDFETTGVNVFADRIVTASFVTIGGSDGPSIHEWLINPGVDIPAEATAVHGVTTEHARANGCQPTEAITAIVGGLGNAMTCGGYPGLVKQIPIVAFNASFDLSMLRAECLRHGIRPPVTVRPVIDPYVIDKAVDRYRPGKRQLAAMCATYGARQEDAHQSTGDVLATLRLVWAMARMARTAVEMPEQVAEHYGDRRYPGELVRAWQRVGRMSLDQLHDAQATWAAEQAESYRQYLIGRGEHDAAAGVVGDWPIREGGPA